MVQWGASQAASDITVTPPQGLVMLEGGPNGRLVYLANRVSLSSPLDPGSQITYADDLDIAADGTIYFTDAQNITTAPNRQVAVRAVMYRYRHAVLFYACQGGGQQ